VTPCEVEKDAPDYVPESKSDTDLMGILPDTKTMVSKNAMYTLSETRYN